MSASETPNTGSENGEKKRAGRNGAAHHSEKGVGPDNSYTFENAEENPAESVDPATRQVSGERIELSFQGQKVRAVLQNGETWFVAVDVCRVLGLDHTTQALSRLDGDERALITVQGNGRPLTVNAICESGMYTLINTSRRPETLAPLTSPT